MQSCSEQITYFKAIEKTNTPEPEEGEETVTPEPEEGDQTE